MGGLLAPACRRSRQRVAAAANSLAQRRALEPLLLHQLGKQIGGEEAAALALPMLLDLLACGILVRLDEIQDRLLAADGEGSPATLLFWSCADNGGRLGRGPAFFGAATQNS